MKFTSIFFKTNGSILEHQLKDTKRQTRNMKLASIFFKTNGSILERQLKDTKKTNEKYEAGSNIFQQLLKKKLFSLP